MTRLTLNLDAADIAVLMEREIRAAERAATRAMTETGNAIKQAWRGDIQRAGLGSFGTGQRLARTVRSLRFPAQSDSIDAAILVWSNAPAIISAFDEGATITAQRASWLAIPTSAAGARTRGKFGVRTTPQNFTERTGLDLQFIQTRDPDTAFLVAHGARIRRGRGTAVVDRRRKRNRRKGFPLVIFVLKRRVRLDKRLDIAGVTERATAGLADLVVARWDDD